ncbi:MAG TPA: hypothetical protein VE078_03795 [Thermoanaerobaculia bacterium]|nr:hypothetical protein [Thermoanaerobaculia bacterium]
MHPMTVLPDLLAVVTVAAGLLWGCGILLSFLLLPRRLRPVLPLVAPFLGFAVIAALGQASVALGGTLRHVRWPVAALAACGWILAFAHPRLRRFPRSSAPALAVCLLAFLLAATPLLSLGYLTTVGGTIDGLSYALWSEYLQGSPARPPALEPGKPWIAWMNPQIRLIRLGDVCFVGLLGLLTGRRSFELLTVVPALFFALTAGALYVFTRVGLRLPRSAALLAALLAAVNNLLLWPVYDNFLSQSLAIAMLPLVLCFGVEGQRRPDWRTSALFGVLLSALAAVYPIYAGCALAGVLLFWAAAWLLLPGGPRGRMLGQAGVWWLGVAACAAAANGFALARAVTKLGFVSRALAPGGAQQMGTGNILVFPPFVEVLGLVAHAGEAYGRGLPQVLLTFLTPLGVGLAILALFGAWRLGPRARLAAAVLLLTGLAFVAQQRWSANAPHGYSYGYFKMISALAPQALALVAAGLYALWRLPSKRWLAGLAGLLLVGINVRHTLWTQSYVLETGIVLDRQMIEAAQAVSRLGPGEWILLDLPQNLRQHWFAYLLRDHRLRYREPLGVLHVETPGEATAFYRYALVDPLLDRRGVLGEPWFDPASYSRLWSNDRYELRRRRGAAMASARWDRRWPDGEAVALDISPGRGTATFSLGAEARELGLGTGTPRTFQVRLFSSGSGVRLTLGARSRPVEIPPGGWLVDIDLGCVGAGQVVLGHAGGDALLADVQVLAKSTGQQGACLETVPARAGAAYVEQRLLDGNRVRFDAVLVRPQGSEPCVYRLGLHIVESRGKGFGIWSLDFPPESQVQQGSMEIDLDDRSWKADLDGRPVRLETSAFETAEGTFEGALVWWRLNPNEQVRIHPVLSFKSSGGTPEVIRSGPATPIEILPPS